MLVYPKNYLPDKSNWSNLGQNYPTLCFMIHSLRICFEIVWRDGAQYRDKKSNMGPTWPKITQLILTALDIFRNILT